MPVLLFPSDRAHHRFATVNAISPPLFPHFRQRVSARRASGFVSSALLSLGGMVAARRGLPPLWLRQGPPAEGRQRLSSFGLLTVSAGLQLEGGG